MGFINEVISQPVLIEYMAGANNYTWLYFHDGREQLISKPLRYFEDRLPDFVRIHKTTLINPHYIQSWEAPVRRRMAGKVRMVSDTVLPVGRRRWVELEKIVFSNQIDPPKQPVSIHDLSVFFLSNDNSKMVLVKETIENNYASHKVHLLNIQLPKFFDLLTKKELPILILLDARTSFMSQINLLNQLKNSPHTASIPTLILVSPNARHKIQHGYIEKANSIIVVSDAPAAFCKTIYQLAQYWLGVARLPTLNTSLE